MSITPTQVHNVLRTYQRLLRDQMPAKLRSGPPQIPEDRVTLSQEGRDRALRSHNASQQGQGSAPTSQGPSGSRS